MIPNNVSSITAQDVPSDIQRMAQEEKLGKLCKVYGASKGNRRLAGIVLIGMGSLIIGSTVLVIFLVMRFDNSYSTPGDDPSILIISIPFTVLILLCIVPGCYMAFSRGIYPRWHIYLWEHGFVYEKGKVRQVFRWEQIESIEGATGFTDSGVGYTYKVHHRDGHTVKLDSNAFPKIAELIDDLLAEVTRQWASQETRIAHSKDMTIFTSIRLDQQGISNGQESIVWKDMQEITLKNGTMIVQRKGGINT